MVRLPEAQSACVIVINSHGGAGTVCTVPEIHVKLGARVHLTRSSLEGDDTTRLSCLFHHLVFCVT